MLINKIFLFEEKLIRFLMLWKKKEKRKSGLCVIVKKNKNHWKLCTSLNSFEFFPLMFVRDIKCRKL